MKNPLFFILIFSLATVFVPSAAMAQPHPTSRQMLASEFIRMATAMAASEPLTVAALEAAVLLANEAIALEPDNRELWHIAMEVAQLAENDSLKARAVESLVRLDPENEQIRLMRLNAALERYQTVEERTVAIERLLTPEHVERLGRPVASRLAHDLALLYQRQGHIERFTKWLSLAIEWDSSNRPAAAMAAGFFRMNVTDPHAEAELLVNLMMADPTDITTQVALARLLLENGAYSAAERFYRLAIRGLSADGREVANDLLADYATASWARGNVEKAIEVLQSRQVALKDAFRSQTAQARPELSMAEIEQLPIPQDPSMMTVLAVVRISTGAEDRAAAINQMLAAYDWIIQEGLKQYEAARDTEADVRLLENQIAGLYVDQAWSGLWMGADADQMERSIAAADAIKPLSDLARARFDGWLAFRRGDLEGASAKLAPIASRDIFARLGLASVFLARGQRADAGREFLAVARAQPGSLAGVWAAHQLRQLLGQPIPPSDEVVALERLIGSVSTQFDRYLEDPSLVLGVRLVPAKLTFAPHEPILFNIEITNASPIPLGIDRNGPIRPHLLVLPSVRSADANSLGDLRPFIINIGRRLRLAPHQKLVIPVNLRHHRPTDALNMLVVSGAIVRLKTILNFNVAAHGVPMPGLYGQEIEAPLLRVDGHRISEEWVKESIPALAQPPTPEMLSRLVVLSYVLAPRILPSAAPEEQALLESARVAMAEAFARLDAYSQAWVLSTMLRGEGPMLDGLEPLRSIARKSTDRFVQLTYLTLHSSGSTDPMIDAGMRGEDPAVRRLAELVKHSAEESERAERDR